MIDTQAAQKFSDTLTAHYAKQIVYDVEHAGKAVTVEGQPLAYSVRVVNTPAALVVNWVDILTKFVASMHTFLVSAKGTPTEKRAAAVSAGVQFYKTAVRSPLQDAVSNPLMPFLYDVFIGPSLDRLVPEMVGGLYDALSKIFEANVVPAGTLATPAKKSDTVPFVAY